VSIDELAQVIEDYHRALDAFTRGDSTPLHALYARRDDVTLANPFGPPVRGWNQVGETMARAAASYRDGQATGFERLAEHTTPEVAYIVETERFRAKVGGGHEPVPFALRVTTIFRREEDGWTIVHRHADPITTPRPAQSVVAS
jgi:ketosteroid isomerase-like protein